MDFIGLLEKAFYRLHRRRNVADYLRDEFGSTAGKPVLDFGGGTGRVSLALAASGPEIFVVADPSFEALHREPAAARVLRVRIQAVPALPFPDNLFPAIFVVDALHHVPDAAGALADCVRCLKPGGRLYVIEFDGRARLARVFGWLVRRQGRSCRFWGSQQLIGALDRLGLTARATRLDGLRFAVRATKPVVC